MNLISAENLSKAFNERVLFTGVTLGLNQGEKAALVGANGAGKTTLLRMLAGAIPPDQGQVNVRKGIRVAYLPQQPQLAGHLTVRELIFDPANPVAAAVGAYEDYLESGLDDGDKLADILGQMDELNAWDFESRAKQVLGALNVHHLDQKADALSGGQRKRVALAQMLLAEPELVLLDEPTNHLDLQAIEWLERYLSTANTTLLMVTHDRYFLDAVCNQVIELDRGQIFRYKGNYAYFLEKKAERESMAQLAVDKARNLLVKELEWMRRQPKARGTKAKYRVDAFYDLKDQASQNLRKDSLVLDVKAGRQGKKIMELNHLHYDIAGLTLLRDFSYVFKRGERIGIIGRNGTGKSTFLNVLTGRLQPVSGQVDPGETTKIGYYTQEVDNLNPENRIIDEVKAIAEYVTLGSGDQIPVSKLLDMFLFPPRAQYGYISKLSGGEKRRLQLLKVLLGSPNFLILDEPTNDLDIDTLNVLEDFLENYQGCLVLVSHDRYFMDKLVEHLFVFEGHGQIRDFPGNYSDWREAEAEGTLAPLEEPKKAAPAAAPAPAGKAVLDAPAIETTPKKRKLSFKEQRELETLEVEIARLEAQKEQLVIQLNEGSSDHQLLTQWSREIERLADEIDAKTLRWMELTDEG